MAAILTTMGCAEYADPAQASPDATERSERLVEVEVGKFQVPLAVWEQYQPEEDPLERNTLLLRFQLHVLVPPGRRADVVRRIETHGARLREEVIHTCRMATIDELSEPALSALKVRVKDVLMKYLGGKYLKSVVLTEVLLEPK